VKPFLQPHRKSSVQASDTPVGSSSLYSIQQQAFCSSPIHLVTDALNQTVPITDSIKQNNLHLFSHPPVRQKSTKQLQMSSLKNDCSFFSIASQIRHIDLDEFFQHENQACPPALSHMGGLRTGTKSDSMPCLENLVPVKENLSTPRIQVNILDGAGIINMLIPGPAKTFQGYATDIFVPYVISQPQHVDRLDIVWDLYMTV